MGNENWHVFLIKSKEPNPSGETWKHSDVQSAKTRANSLASLHGTDTPQIDFRRRTVTVDASDYYS